MCTMHQLAVPEEAKQEDETKRCNECDEEFFPVHNLFRLRLLLSPRSPETFIAKCVINVDVNFSRLTAYENDEARMTNVERSPNAQMTKRENAWFVIRTSSFLRHWTFVIRHCIRFNIQPEFAQETNIHIGCWVFRCKKFVAVKNRIRAGEKTECLTLA